MSAFLTAVENNDADKVFKLLAKADADERKSLLEMKNQYQKSVLHIAAENGNANMILFMLNFINQGDAQTFLDTTFINKRDIATGKGRDILDKFTAFDLARQYHHQKKGKKEEKNAIETMLLLYKMGAPISEEDENKFLYTFTQLKEEGNNLLDNADDDKKEKISSLFGSIEELYDLYQKKGHQPIDQKTKNGLLIEWKTLYYATQLQKQAISYLNAPTDVNKKVFEDTLNDAKKTMQGFKGIGEKALDILKNIGHFLKAVVQTVGYSILATVDAKKAKTGLAKVKFFRDSRGEEEKGIGAIKEQYKQYDESHAKKSVKK
jgi:hypothetical protein